MRMSTRHPLLSRGKLRDIEFTYHPIADGRECWQCANCEAVFYDDGQTNEDNLCADCAKDSMDDNPLSENK